MKQQEKEKPNTPSELRPDQPAAGGKKEKQGESTVSGDEKPGADLETGDQQNKRSSNNDTIGIP